MTGALANAGLLRAALIGVWTLRQYAELIDGQTPLHPFGLNPEGLLIYTADGFVSAMLMAPDRPSLSGNGLIDGTPGEFAALGRGFIGYSGAYDVDEAESVVTHYPLVAFVPKMIGRRQERHAELNADTMVLTATHVQPDGLPAKSRLEWVRSKSARPEERR